MLRVEFWLLVIIAVCQVAMCNQTVDWHENLGSVKLKKQFCGDYTHQYDK